VTKLTIPAFLVAFATAGLATAEPAARFEVVDRGDAVEVIGHGMTAAGPEVRQVRERLEVQLTAAPAIKRVDSDDGTVKLMELNGRKSLSVKLRLERPEVQALASVAQVTQVGDDLHLIFPRRFAAGGTPAALPEPTVSAPKPAAPIEAPSPVAAAITAPVAIAAPAPTPEPETKPAAAAPTNEPAAAAPAAAATTAAPATAAAAAAAPATDAPAATAAATEPTKSTVKPSQPDKGSPNQMIIVAGLCCLALGVYIMKKRRGTGKPVASIDVIAQRALGGKAKVVWLTAGDREMVVAVTPQNVRMLGAWRKGTEGMMPAEEFGAGAANSSGFLDDNGNDALDGDPEFLAAALPEATALRPSFPRPNTRMGAYARASTALPRAATSNPASTAAPAPRARTAAPVAPAATPARARTMARGSTVRPSTSSDATSTMSTTPATPAGVSPAVSGILRLRQQTMPPPDLRTQLEEDNAREDAEADRIWAREIIEATGGRAS
jgi:hypothetical protein